MRRLTIVLTKQRARVSKPVNSVLTALRRRRHLIAAVLHKLRVASDVTTLLEHPRTASTQTDTTGKLTCIITLPSITSSHPSMDITFLSVCPSVGLPLSGMAQKVGDVFSRKVLEGCDMRLAATYS